MQQHIITHLGVPKRRVGHVEQLGYREIHWANSQSSTFGNTKNAVNNFWNVIMKREKREDIIVFENSIDW